MEVVIVLFLVLFNAVILAVVLFAVRPALRGVKHAEGPSDATATRGTVAPPTTLEGALIRQLLDGEINREQYRCALERLAVRDDQQHPLSVPEKGDSSAGA